MATDLLILLIVMIYVFGLIEQEWQKKKIMQFLFQKLLKHIDVGTFGIITSKNVFSMSWNHVINTIFFFFNFL